MNAMRRKTNLRGLDLEADARDKDDHSANECFLQCRSAHCAVARDSMNRERESWVRLMRSARRRDEDSLCIVDENEDKEMGQGSGDVCDRYRHSDEFLGSSEAGSGSVSEEEFVDADECNEKED